MELIKYAAFFFLWFARLVKFRNRFLSIHKIFIDLPSQIQKYQ